MFMIAISEFELVIYFLGGFVVLGIPICLVLLFWFLERVGFLPRRYQPGHCPNCDYDLTGNLSGRCPECGSKIARD